MKRESERNTWELRDQTEELQSMLLMLKVILRGTVLKCNNNAQYVRPIETYKIYALNALSLNKI